MIREWNITIPALTGEEQRKAYVYVPDSAYADAQRRYPVLYMFDGQNLFSDSEATYGKSWGLLDWLTEHNTPLIVAAAECSRHAETDDTAAEIVDRFDDRNLGKSLGNLVDDNEQHPQHQKHGKQPAYLVDIELRHIRIRRILQDRPVLRPEADVLRQDR